MTTIYMKQNDRLPELEAYLQNSDGTVPSLSGTTLRFYMREKGLSTAKISGISVTLVDAVTGLVRYSWAAGDTDTAGDYEAEFEVTYPDGRRQTFPNDGYLRVLVQKEL